MAAASGSRQQRWSLAGATALVTGGSKGIGHAVVEELAGFGARVHTCARNAADLEESRRRWAEKGLVVTVSVCDVSVPADREKLMDTVKATFDGKLDILVNNAGQAFFKAAAECTAEDYSHVMTTNLESGFHLCQLAHPLLVGSSIAGGGSVVHISSIASYLGVPGLALYCISKGAMNQLTRSLAAEWSPDKIRVNCVAPGAIMTDMVKQISSYEKELEEMKHMTRQEYIAYLRRNSSGFSRGASKYRRVTRHHQHGRWQARIGRVAGNKDLYLGKFSRTRTSGTKDVACSDAEGWRGRGGGVRCVVSVYAGVFLYHWPGHLHRRWPDHKWLASNNLSNIYTTKYIDVSYIMRYSACIHFLDDLRFGDFI